MPDPDESLVVDGLWIDESYCDHDRDTFEIILTGHAGWRLSIEVGDYEYTLWLKDEETE